MINPIMYVLESSLAMMELVHSSCGTHMDLDAKLVGTGHHGAKSRFKLLSHTQNMPVNMPLDFFGQSGTIRPSLLSAQHQGLAWNCRSRVASTAIKATICTMMGLM